MTLISRQSSNPQPLERRRSRLPLALLGLVALAAVLALSFGVFRRSVVYYKTPTEALDSGGRQIRLSGEVVTGSIAQDVTSGVSFRVTDGETTLRVVYDGPAPDTLKDQAEAVAEGSLGADGVFRATQLFARCPSKFQTSGAAQP